MIRRVISHHLRQLRQSGLIHARRDATDKRWVHYSVDREALVATHGLLLTIFDPARIGRRAPDCRPSSTGCSKRFDGLFVRECINLS
ncbi:MAG: helix-turn-helix transcriptional regulator [Chloroflexi bacterium]|nr:helix-turn-helix transcriptional regulator [Chloroflexota bacterium]